MAKRGSKYRRIHVHAYKRADGVRVRGHYRYVLRIPESKQKEKEPGREPSGAWGALPGLDTIADHTGDTNGRMLPGKTIGDMLYNVQQMAPHRRSNGLLYRTQENRDSRTQRATLFLYLHSSDGTYAVHETIFSSHAEKKRNSKDWAAWFNEHVYKGTGDNEDAPPVRMGILHGAVLPGVAIKSGKAWTVKDRLGFMMHDLSKPARAEMAGKRHKTKSQKRSRGQDHIRRGHRNRKRKAK